MKAWFKQEDRNQSSWIESKDKGLYLKDRAEDKNGDLVLKLLKIPYDAILLLGM